MRRPVVAALLALSACTTDEPQGPGIEGNSHVAAFDVPAVRPIPIDVLFALDDRTDMQPYQSHVADLAAQAALVLASFNEGMPDLRVGVTTTSGMLRSTQTVTDPYLVDIGHYDFTETKNYGGTLAEALASLFSVGAANVGPNHLLEAETVVAQQSPLVRAEALLAIVTMTATDDESPRGTTDYVFNAKTFKQDPNAVVEIGFYPQPQTHLDAFYSSFPNRNATLPIDADDYTPALSIIKPVVKTTLPLQCFLEPADADPETPGAQYDCAIEAEGGSGVLPRCTTDSTAPCWDFVMDPQNCFGPETMQLVIHGYPGRFHPALHGQCAVK